MRILALGLLLLAACDRQADEGAASMQARPAEITFDGGDYRTEAAKLAHGKRLATTLFGCNGCHGADYAGQDFGAMIPIVAGLWASNISRTMPNLSDAELERLLRDGVHPDRDLYVMPSKQTHFLSDSDMKALIAHLRTVKPVGEPTPVPPEGFVEAVTARLPDDYWRTLQEGKKRSYHNAAEEVAYYAANRPPDFGPALAKGRMIATTICSGCHGAALDGVGEPAGDIQGALQYDDADFNRLLIKSIDRTGKKVIVEWGIGHDALPLTPSERREVIAYVRALARARSRG
jgi:cytochrome c553